MRKLLTAMFAGSVILTIVSLFYLPPKVAIHFGVNGIPDSWGSREFQVFFFLGMNLVLFLMFLFMPSFILKLPKRLISLPNREYWLAKENIPRFKALFEELWWEYGAALFLFLLLTEALTIDANLSSPVQLNNGIFWFFFIAFIGYTVYWIVRLSRAFTVPADNGP